MPKNWLKMTPEEKINQNQEVPEGEVIQAEKEQTIPSVFSTDVFQHIQNLNITTPPVVEDNIYVGEEETETAESFSISNYNFIGEILIGVLDSVVILGAWVYARQYIPDVKYSEIEKIIGLRKTEKTELGRLLGRILAKYQWIITEEVLFVVSLVRIYSMNKVPALMEYLKQNTPQRKTSKTQKRQTKKKKQEIKTKDVLEEIKPEE